jgi:hypothetical protein
VSDNTLQTGTDDIRTKDRAGVKTPITGIDLQPGGSEKLMTSVADLGIQQEDVASAGGEYGSYVLTVRRDAPSADTSNAGDFAGLQTDSLGRLYVMPAPLVTHVAVDSAGLTTSITSYSSGDVLGTEWTFAVGSRSSGATSLLVGAQLITKATAVPGATELWLFDQASNPAGDNAPNSWVDADMLHFLGRVLFDSPTFSANNGIAPGRIDGNGVLGLKPVATSVFGTLITRSAHTFFGSTGDLRIRLHVQND